MASSDHPFKVVAKRYKQKQLKKPKQSVLTFSPHGLLAKAKPMTKQNKKNLCCTCTERSTCANKKCACAIEQKNYSNCKCLKRCVNNFSSKLVASKPNIKSIQSNTAGKIRGWKPTASGAKTSITDI